MRALEYEDYSMNKHFNKGEGRKMTKEQKQGARDIGRVTDIDKLSLSAIQWFVMKRFVSKHKLALSLTLNVVLLLNFVGVLVIIVDAVKQLF